jgi:DNA-directed RNA polymerase subunit RPC12/RpoP
MAECKCKKCGATGYEGIFYLVSWVCEKCGFKNFWKEGK